MEKELNPLGKMLFNMQRFQILQAKLNPQLEGEISDSYAYAWDAKIYPYFHDGELHEDLKDYFTVSGDEVNEVTKFADDEWRKEKRYTFYEYERHFNIRQGSVEGLTRSKLLKIFRYCFLKEMFDDAFWAKLVEPQKHPTEASGIVRKFSLDKVFLI